MRADVALKTVKKTTVVTRKQLQHARCMRGCAEPDEILRLHLVQWRQAEKEKCEVHEQYVKIQIVSKVR